MKKILTIIILSLCFILSSHADDIRDFQIEGMSIGDSLLNYFSKDQIKNAPRYDNTNTVAKSDKFYEARFKKIGNYEEILFHLKKNDQSFIIYSISGVEKYENNISDCYKKIEIIADELKSLFKDTKKKEDKIPHKYDKTGKSTIKYINYDFKSGDRVSIQCYDWTKKMGYWDNLRISILSKEILNWIQYEQYN